ncbi:MULTISPECIES: pyridoxamine 5'-phosphate oxidase family protein [Arthrobacter]|uniref:Pyridoxamine 5'-phosphate oxidase family protein n=1 Tax=Arthrobacter caoxuetaonis TaxID=2886935 RepID=A0A9X1MC87_9MICC|nr:MULTISPECIES: pyridoxamine 5'-phosphate oxidase family protein [Arthrobacter]MCC3282219.1 pyridoxamine 5'-phosphate oxidase family protein [Arthrobacter caoxuetaonis]MCC3297393.1 pyridoxamine 5'-phosphate oxidase family protein [Arthrobacter caoxuetaonis]MCC9194283.1 pyridoxamine 5'-phosphate oxidase family protein [Arthrobacter sp. zg-Y916]USQ58073.1 pyridoxamine 5'-phosphate oxidase family protein [Arthrobacter caoxuetaonis]
MTSEEKPPVVELTAEESWKYVEKTFHGRIATSVAGEPDIFPINYYAHDGVLLFRTAPGNKLAELTVNSHVAFETDGIMSDEAWSVVIKGTTRELELSAEIEEAEKLPLKPWVRTRKSRYVELTPTSISGRFFNLGPEPEDEY